MELHNKLGINNEKPETSGGHPSESDPMFLLRNIYDASLNGILSLSAVRKEVADSLSVSTNTDSITLPIPINDFIIVNANKSSSQIFKVDLEEMIGKNLLTIPTGNLQSKFFEMYLRVAEGGSPERAIDFYENDNGVRNWFEVCAVNQGPDQLVVTFNNITDQKANETQSIKKQEQLNIAIQELRRSNENLQQFAFVASHDLQEPLRKIQSFGQILRRKYSMSLDVEGQELIGRMESAAERMSILINDLLDYSRLSVQLQPLKLEGLNKIVQDVLVILEQSINEKKAIIEVGDLGAVPGDSFQLTQMFQNLIANSLKFSRSGVIPHVKITSHEEDIHIDTLPGQFVSSNGYKKYCVITIEDNGIGFNQNQAENIFGTFQRLHGKSEYPGTGIGLAIVKKVVENHNGCLNAQGFPSEGSKFSIYLPVENNS